MRKNAINVMSGIFLAVILSLAGCGGGGNGGTAAIPTPMGTAVNMLAFKSVYLGTSTGATYISPLSLAQIFKEMHGLARTL